MKDLVTLPLRLASGHFASQRSPGSQLAYLAFGNAFLLAALFLFTSGFLSSALFPNDVSAPTALENLIPETQDDAPFSRVVFLLVDALRSDFVYGKHSGFGFTQSLIRDGAALPFTAHVAPPTVTLPRIKAITTGSIPGFADVMGNLDQSDNAFFTSHDSWLGQLRAAGREMVFYGDDTWLRLSASKGSNSSFFLRSEGVHGWLTSEYTEVDRNVTRHVAGEMEKSDWDAMILHYLGVDHIGHMSGPQAPHMIGKQKQMDDVVKLVFEALETREHHKNTLLVLLGDHGMNEGGNHGGSDAGETESALVFASPKFRTMRVKHKYECPTLPANGTDFDYYRKVEQQDLVPTLSALLGLPIPRNSIGTILSELRGMWPDEESYVHVLARNAQQLWRVALAVFDSSASRDNQDLESEMTQNRTSVPDHCTNSDRPVERLAYLLASAEKQALQSRRTQQWTKAATAYDEFLAHAQQALIKENRSFSLVRMAAGIALCSIGSVLCWYSIGAGRPSRTISVSCVCIALVYGLALLSSTSEKSEQYFWYLTAPAWIVFLAVRATSRTQDGLVQRRVAWAVVRVLALHCIAACWMLCRSWIEKIQFAGHKPLIWSTLLITHFWMSAGIVQRTLSGIVAKATAVSLTIPLVSTAFVFKICQEFEQAGGTASFFGMNQIILFRTLLGMTSLAAGVICTFVARRRSQLDVRVSLTGPTLPKRLHHLLTLFLMMQSRILNLPLFLCLDHQRSCLEILLHPVTRSPPNPANKQGDQLNGSDDSTATSSIHAAITVLAFSQTYFFAFGGSNSISGINLSNAYNGITNYSILTVGVLLFSANWTGPIWWSSAACSLVPYDAPQSTPPLNNIENKHRAADNARNGGDERLQAQDLPWLCYLSALSALMAAITLIVMILCTVQREHDTVWTLWGSKYLYSVFWVLEWHVVVSLGLSSCLRALRSLG